MFDNWLMDLGKRMRAARQQRGLKQADVAAMLQCTRGAVSQFETGLNKPSLETLIAFAQGTGVSLDWLILGRPSGGQYDQRIQALPEALREYVVQALLLAERVQLSIPQELLVAPTSANYAQFSKYLADLSAQPARKTPA